VFLLKKEKIKRGKKFKCPDSFIGIVGDFDVLGQTGTIKKLDI